MTTEAVEAWVLHKRPSGDSSAQVIFFTREKGIVNCLVKGGRAPKKQALLQAFQPLWLAFDTRKDWPYARHLEPITRAHVLGGHALFAGFYLNELLYYVLKPKDPHPELFDRYLQTLEGLSFIKEKLGVEVLLRRFEWDLLRVCGYSISFNEEAHTAKAIDEAQLYRFSATEGFIASAEGTFSGRELLALGRGELNEIQLLRTAKQIMRQAVEHLLGGRELKSRSLYPLKRKKY